MHCAIVVIQLLILSNVFMYIHSIYIMHVVVFKKLRKHAVIVYREELLECSEHGRTTVTGAGKQHYYYRELLHSRAWCLNGEVHVHETKGVHRVVG